MMLPFRLGGRHPYNPYCRLSLSERTPFRGAKGDTIRSTRSEPCPGGRGLPRRKSESDVARDTLKNCHFMPRLFEVLTGQKKPQFTAQPCLGILDGTFRTAWQTSSKLPLVRRTVASKYEYARTGTSICRSAACRPAWGPGLRTVSGADGGTTTSREGWRYAGVICKAWQSRPRRITMGKLRGATGLIIQAMERQPTGYGPGCRHFDVLVTWGKRSGTKIRDRFLTPLSLYRRR